VFGHLFPIGINFIYIYILKRYVLFNIWLEPCSILSFYFENIIKVVKCYHNLGGHNRLVESEEGPVESMSGSTDYKNTTVAVKCHTKSNLLSVSGSMNMITLLTSVQITPVDAKSTE